MSPLPAPRRDGEHRHGFSLVELMVVVVIIGLLATLVVPNVIKRLSDSQRVAAQTDLMTLHEALTEYAIQNNGVYPEGLIALVTPDENGRAYLERRTLPTDPWGFEYHYERPTDGDSRPRVYTLGRDGVVGGEGDDRDLSNLDVLDGLD